jgi:hypothetical protein
MTKVCDLASYFLIKPLFTVSLSLTCRKTTFPSAQFFSTMVLTSVSSELHALALQHARLALKYSTSAEGFFCWAKAIPEAAIPANSMVFSSRCLNCSLC